MALVACMDPRIQIKQSTGPSTGDAFVLRNAGGRVTDDVIRGLVLCTRLLGVTEIGVLHHTDCRLAGFTNAELVAKTGVDLDFMAFCDPADSVLTDVAALRSRSLFGGEIRIWGGVYLMESHTVQVVV
jgi:carbonic anhydrase